MYGSGEFRFAVAVKAQRDMAQLAQVLLGDVAEQNLRELGHITLRFDGHREAEFPGTVHVAGPVPEGIAAGCVLKFVA